MAFAAIPNISIAGHRQGNEVLILLSGSLRMMNGEAVKLAILPLLEEPVETLNLYVSQLTEVDSAGLGVLVGLHMTSRKRKIQLKVLAPTAFLTRLLESTKLTSVLTVVHGIEAEAIRNRLEVAETAI